MDFPKVVFSLLLIVAGYIITLGSPIKDEYPNGKELEELQADQAMGRYPEMIPNHEELEALLMRSNRSNPVKEKDAEMSPSNQGTKGLLLISSDQDNTKRGVTAIVVAGATLTYVALDSFLRHMGSISRKMAIGIDNESGHKWSAVNVYFYSGTSDQSLPGRVDPGKALLYGARKTAGPWATGVVGVLTYHISSISRALAVMFSVPFDYNWYENWWNVKLYTPIIADKKKYNDMYYDSNPFKGDNGWHYRDLGSGLKFRGAMSSSGQATLMIHVSTK